MIDHQIGFSRRLMLGAGAVALLSGCGSGGAGRAARTLSPAAGPSAPAQAPPQSPVPASSAEPAARAPEPAPADTPDGAPDVPEYHLHAGPMTLALTFDDGPAPATTDQILATLRRHGVTATFFMIGANVEKYPDVVRRVVEDGHRLGNHTWSHPDLGTLSAAEVRDELERTNEIIARAGRTDPPTLFRAPGGNFTKASLAVGAAMGLRPVSWSVDPEDWSRPGTDAIVERVMSQSRTGSIVLEHDGCLTPELVPAPGGPADRSQTVEALARYLPQLIDAGYRFATVGPAA
ncbi:polysaccharide deacetylase family protein [Kitasatospora mediocidica]|uniref:polysaccharide deacetylase family protein n=1 Tax=Kitasatospora mediocidica TaxID=58352 RepID=UPI0007C6B7C3|nr:polysaccharide deacetylase family protein [Kitasatospora mediocidica]